MKCSFIKLVPALAVLASCSGAKVYQSNDTESLIANQKTLAIAPPAVSLTPKKHAIGKEIPAERKKTETENFQRETYAWWLKRLMQGKASQEIQDIETTNARLKRARLLDETPTKEELCRALKVDGVVTSSYNLSKPVGEEIAAAASILLGIEGKTNEIKAAISIYDCKAQKVFWNYDNTYSGGWTSSYSDLVESLMRNASKKIPYGKK